MKTTKRKDGYMLPSKDKMIQALISEHFDKLRMVQQDELIRIKNDHHRKGYICPAEGVYLTSLFIDVVLNGKHYNSKQSILLRTDTKSQPIAHIGMQVAALYGYQQTN